MNHIHLISRVLLALILAFTLTACGGGGGGGGSSQVSTAPTPPAPPTPPTPPGGGNQPGQPGGGTDVVENVIVGSKVSPDDLTRNSDEFSRSGGLSLVGAESSHGMKFFGHSVTVEIAAFDYINTRHVDISSDRPETFSFGSCKDNDFLGSGICDGVSSNRGMPVNKGITGDASIIAGRDGGDGILGVAPRSKIIDIFLREHTTALIGYFRHRNVRDIKHNGFEVKSNIISAEGAASTVYFTKDTEFPDFFDFPDLLSKNLSAVISDRERAKRFGFIEPLWVWGVGDDGWKKDGLVKGLCNINVGVNNVCPTVNVVNTMGIGISDFTSSYPTIILKRRDPDGVFHLTATIFLTSDISHISETSVGGGARLPIDLPHFESHWLAVAAVDNSSVIADFSNGCGEAKNWCLSAPGVNIMAADGTSTTGVIARSDTRIAAAHVSGAAAVLKGKSPDLPHEVIRAILLASASTMTISGRDASSRVDDIYGWGVLDISNALDVMTTIGTRVTAGANPSGYNITIHGVKFMGVGAIPQLPFAVNGHGNIPAFNMNFADLVDVENNPTRTSLGRAANGMLAAESYSISSGVFFGALDSETNELRGAGVRASFAGFGEWEMNSNFCDTCETSVWHGLDLVSDDVDFSSNSPVVPFFAADNGVILQGKTGEFSPFAVVNRGDDESPAYSKFGVQWNRGFGFGGINFNFHTEVARVDEEDTFWGSDFSSLGFGGITSHQGQVALRGNIGDWGGFASYNEMRSEGSSGGIVSRLSGMVSRGWAAGLQKDNLFAGGDRFRLAVRQEPRTVKGELELSHQRAEGDFTQAFLHANGLGGEALVVKNVKSVIDLRGAGRQVYAIGYALPLSDQSTLAGGLEYASDNTKAASAAWTLNF